MACEELEIDIEKRHCGALDEVATQRLSDHLGQCASCQAYEQAMTRMEDTMTTMTTAAARQFDVRGLSLRIQGRGKEQRNAFWRALILLPIVMPAIVLGAMPAGARLFGWVLGVTVGAGMLLRMGLERRRFERETVAAASSRGDLLALWRREVDRRIAMIRMWPMNIIASVLLPLPAILDRDHSLPTGGAAFVYGLAVVMLIQGLYYGLVELPRLRRERAGLD